MCPNKKAYFQGDGGPNEPTPGKKKYKSDPAIVVQPRFEEPFYRNYDLYTIPGMEHVGPGTGWHGLQNYKSVKEFLDARRERLKPRYVADDSWQMDNGNRVKKNPERQARASIFEKIIKQARMPGMSLVHKLNDKFKGDDNDGPNFDYGDGAYTAMSEGKKIKTITDAPHKSPGAFFADDNEDHMLPPKEHGTSIYDWKNSPYQGVPKAPKKKHDVHSIDYPIDENIGSGPILGDSESYNSPIQLGPTGEPDTSISPESVNLGDSESYPYSAQIGGLLDKYLPQNDSEDKTPAELDFGRDYTGDEPKMDSEKVKNLIDKYLNPAPTSGLFGLPDGVDLPDEDLGNPTNINPDYGTTDVGITMYEDKWNI
jgi:hypothetical protein